MIKSSNFSVCSDINSNIIRLKELHDRRVTTDSSFRKMVSDIEKGQKNREKKYISLNETVRKKELDEYNKEKQKTLTAEGKDKLPEIKKKSETSSKDDADDDIDELAGDETDLKEGAAQRDPQLHECGNIIADYIGMKKQNNK
jgi:carboxyl-terminal processing protease